MPDPTADALWWSFAVDPAVRADLAAARLTDDAGRPLVNAPDAEGRLGLDYGAYLGLDALLAAGTPSSRVPDERAFVAIHQLCEVAFKLMLFDLGVVARTFGALLEMDDAPLRALATEGLPDERGPTPFWRPALTAAARLRHSARRVLPALMPFVGKGEDDDVLFSTLEFALFRPFLAPSSGFQSAQLRLIQRALGKGPLLNVPVFPGDVFGHHYTGARSGPVALGDPLILRSGHARAFPPDGAPEAIVAQLDSLAHDALARLAGDADGAAVPPVRPIHPVEVERAVVRVRATLGDREDANDVAEAFRAAFERAADDENARRDGLDRARRGAQALLALGRPTCLTFVLDRLVATDLALHASDAGTFLTTHRRTVRRHVADDSGTGGGGMPYLVTSQRFLLPLFPALVAYADLHEEAADSERW